MKYIDNPVAYQQYLHQHCHCVNAGQSPEERRAKYKLCKLLGDNYYNAFRRRDWTYNHIAKVHGYTDYKTMIKILIGE